MQQSNGYIIGFAAVMTIVLGGLLAGAAMALKPAQQKAKALDTKKQILSAVMPTKGVDKTYLEGVYNAQIKSFVLDFEGNEVKKDDEGNDLIAEKVNIRKESKKDENQRFYPVYLFYEEGNTSTPVAYIIPIYGKGLWDDIWGYLAVKPDFNTIRGVSFDHKSETPGLGARITEVAVQERYKDQKLFDEGGQLVSVRMLKGENNQNLNEHQVDGMSGATITANGVNKMIKEYVSCYEVYFSKMRKAS
ncbi:MAG: NADH:ubiquinone reductase (Na(+)-transporting) subunit C [Flammeovirgaceae bacterium]